ncbi:MAG: ABC transporter permease [Clostridia bacterium]|nr:ABC transporter permease [Clostridia bacterium]
MLFRKMLRDIRGNLSQFIAIFLMVFLAGLCYTGIKAYSDGMKMSSDVFYTDYALADLIAYGEGFDEDDLKKVLDTAGVKAAERYLTVSGTSDVEGHDEPIKVEINFIDREESERKVNRFAVSEGIDYDPDADGLWLGRLFAEANDIHAGDSFTVKYEGYELEKKVLGIIDVPDHAYVVSDQSVLFQSADSFAWVYMSMDQFPPEYIYDKVLESDEVQEALDSVEDLQPLVDMGLSFDSIASMAGIEEDVDLGKAYELKDVIREKTATVSQKEEFIKALDPGFEAEDAYVYPMVAIDVEGEAELFMSEETEGFTDRLNDVKDSLYDIDAVTAVSGRDTMFSYVSYKSECEEGDTYSVMFTFIFLFIGVLSVITTMNRFVKKQRVQIGTLKALGFRKGRIVRHYLGYGFFVSLAGAVLGELAGVLTIGKYFMGMEAAFYGIHDMKSYVKPGNYFIAVLLVLVVMAVTYFSTVRILKEPAAQALRLEVPTIRMKEKEGGKGLTSHMSFSAKWNLRDIRRSKARSTMAIVGVMGATLLMVVAFGLNDSFDRYLDWEFESICNYEYKIGLAGSYTEAELASVQDLYGDATSQSLAIEYKDKEGNLVTSSLMVNDSEGMVRISDHDLNTYSIDDGIPGSTEGDINEKGALVVTEKLLKTLGLEPGDTLEWRFADADQWYETAVRCVCRDPQSQTFQMTREAYDALGRDYVPDAVYTDKDLSDTDPQDIPGVASIVSRAALRDQIEQFLSVMSIMIGLFMVMAGAMGFIIIYNMGCLSLSEKMYQFATLKVLGFRFGKIRNIFVQQNIWLSLVGILLGLPAGFAFTDMIFRYSIGDQYDFFATIMPDKYIISAAYMLLVVFLTDLVLGRGIRRIDMVSALKANE